MSFKITGSKGFHLRFTNGLVLSTQFGGGNYCDNYDEVEIGSEGKLGNPLISSNAEIAIWIRSGKRKGEWLTEEMVKELFPGETADQVMGYVGMEKWLKVVDWCRGYKR